MSMSKWMGLSEGYVKMGLRTHMYDIQATNEVVCKGAWGGVLEISATCVDEVRSHR